MNELSKVYEEKLHMLIREILASNPVDYQETAKQSHYPISHNQRYLTDNYQATGVLGPFYYNFESEEKLRETFQKFTELFPVLAATYSEIDGAIVQKPLAPSEVDFGVQVVTYENEDEVAEISKKYLTDAYETVNGQLIRLFVGINKEDGKSFLLLGIHHSLTDHQSNMVIGHNLTNFLAGIPVQANKTTNVDFLNWQEKFLVSRTGIEYRNHWKDVLKNSTDPASKTLKSENNMLSVSEFFYIEGELFSKLNDIHLKTNLPMTAVLMAIHKKMILNIFNIANSIQLTMTNGREQQDDNFDFANNLGVMNNLLPLPFTSSEDESVENFIRRGYADYLKSRVYQQIPYNVIVNDLFEENGMDVDFSSKGIFSFRYANGDNPNSENQNKEEELAFSIFDMKDRVDMTCVFSETTIEIQLDYPKYLIEEDTVTEFKPDFLNIVELFTENL